MLDNQKDKPQAGQNPQNKSQAPAEDVYTIGASPQDIKQKQTDQTKPKVPVDSTISITRTLKTYSREQEEKQAKREAELLGYPYVYLFGQQIDYKILKIIPKEIAQKYKVVPFYQKEGKITIAAVYPEDKEMVPTILELTRAQDLDVSFAVASNSSIQYAIKGYEFVPPTKEAEPEKLEITPKAKEEFEKEIDTLASLREKIQKVSITKLLEVLMSGAVKNRASDIHLEPREKGFRVRYRIDGVLHTIVDLPIESYKKLVQRIKFLAKLKMDLTTLPQDGKFSVTALAKRIDIRVSTLPTVYGENIVMRLLEQETAFYTLKELGFNKLLEKQIIDAISKPHGIVLNTGPTGSGKTTTLYAILDHINKPGVKIITLEDPVEYQIPGISQSQVDISRKYNYARGLRSIIRQDPDVIMVGEIRDRETAETAIQAGLTGHLVLSTLHTNDAPATMTRLLDMGIQPYLLTGSINLVVAQRLVRKICSHCKEEYVPKKDVIDLIKKVWDSAPKSLTEGKPVPDKLWRGKGCIRCNETGYLGRIAIAEGLVPGTEIEELVVSRKPTSDIQKKAQELGMATMEQDGIQKVIIGETTIEEIWRVTKQ